jgi:hypothetical protein
MFFPDMSAATEDIERGKQVRNQGDLPMARALYAQAAQLYREQNDALAYAHTIRHMALLQSFGMDAGMRDIPLA